MSAFLDFSLMTRMNLDFFPLIGDGDVEEGDYGARPL